MTPMMRKFGIVIQLSPVFPSHLKIKRSTTMPRVAHEPRLAGTLPNGYPYGTKELPVTRIQSQANQRYTKNRRE